MLLKHLYGRIYYILQFDSNSRLSTTVISTTTTTYHYHKSLHYPVQNHKRNTERHKRICVLILKFLMMHVCNAGAATYLTNNASFYLPYLPYLSSIHEKANCIAILWTGSPHSLGSCLFRGLWVTCLPHEGGASR